MKRIALILILCGCAASFGADPPRKPIRLPVGPVVPQPMPAPDAPAALSADQLYIIDSDVPVRVLASPPGLVRVTKESGPLKIRGQFVDGVPGKSETRTYEGKSIYSVEAIGNGRVEILVIPEGAAAPDDADVIRRIVDAKLAARPPCPDPKPEPKPEPKAVAWVIVVEETMDRTPATARVLNDLDYWKGLASAGYQWRFYDKDSPDAIAKNYPALAAEVGLPAVLLLDASGKKIGAAKLPATTDELTAFVKGGGK